MNAPPQDNSKKMLIIVVAVLGGIGLISMLCCGVFAYVGYDTVSNLERTYYAECEDLDDSQACQRCCSENGHNGFIHGAGFNDEGKACGCI